MSDLMDWLYEQRDENRAKRDECHNFGYHMTSAMYDGIVNAYTQVITHIKETEMRDVQKIVHDEIAKAGKYGVSGDEWNDGYISGLSFALHRVVEADGVNRTGCEAFDIKETES